jgi:hypothetical protein
MTAEAPTIRLACIGSRAIPAAPTVRLAHGGPPEAVARGLGHPTVRLAHAPGAQGDNVLLGKNGHAPLPPESRPALLVSYFYLAAFERARQRYSFRDWALDSGAFSAHNSGVTIELAAYIEKCRALLTSDPLLAEVFSLDVIGDWRAGLRNTEAMWKAGVPAIPTYHIGEPNDVLLGLARDYPKIALGGVARKKGRGKIEWAERCFAKVWPKRIHGFGFGAESLVMALPWHSVDSTSWELRTCRYGYWNAFGARLPVYGSKQNLRVEVEWYLGVERKARQRWAREMAKLDALDGAQEAAR